MKEIISGILLIVLVFFISNPFGLYMPNPVFMTALFLAVVAFGVFASFVLRERPRDEREDAHRMFAGRIAFFLGTAVLMLGILIQAFSHTVDIWLVYGLSAMIFGKIIALIWARDRG